TRSVFLLNPGTTAITGAQNHAAAANNPGCVFTGELHTQQSRARRRSDLAPGSTGILSEENCAPLADGDSLLTIAKIDVIKRYGDAGFLACPCFAGVFRVQDGAAGSYDPTALIVNKIDVNQFLTRARFQHLPGGAAIASDGQHAADNVVAAGQRANDPA